MKHAKVLTEKELKRVLQLCEVLTHGARNKLAIQISHYVGLRVGEIASLKWTDVLDRDQQPRESFYLKAENTKAKEARQVHVNQRLQRAFLVYWQSLGRYKRMTDPVILSQRGAFSANSLGQLYSYVYGLAGISDASSHSGRRWFITQLANSGVSPKVIMELAGHKQLTTTQRYIDVTEEQKRNAVDLL